jgi:hypothetical protein
LSDEEMETAGITDSLVRVSVGIEDWRDVLADFEQALARSDAGYFSSSRMARMSTSSTSGAVREAGPVS